MNRDQTSLEEALLGCSPAKLDPRLLARLADTLEQASAPVAAADLRLEAWLERQEPAVLPDGLMERLATLAEPAEPAGRVVAMPERPAFRRYRPYAAAAAIALFGAAIALFAPIGGHSPQPLADTEVETRIIPLDEARKFVPASYARGLCEARDEGVVWRDNTPHRVLRIVYLDMMTLTSESGEKMEVEQPCVEYIVVPEKID